MGRVARRGPNSLYKASAFWVYRTYGFINWSGAVNCGSGPGVLNLLLRIGTGDCTLAGGMGEVRLSGELGCVVLGLLPVSVIKDGARSNRILGSSSGDNGVMVVARSGSDTGGDGLR